MKPSHDVTLAKYKQVKGLCENAASERKCQWVIDAWADDRHARRVLQSLDRGDRHSTHKGRSKKNAAQQS